MQGTMCSVLLVSVEDWMCFACVFVRACRSTDIDTLYWAAKKRSADDNEARTTEQCKTRLVLIANTLGTVLLYR